VRTEDYILRDYLAHSSTLTRRRSRRETNLQDIKSNSRPPLRESKGDSRRLDEVLPLREHLVQIYLMLLCHTGLSWIVLGYIGPYWATSDTYTAVPEHIQLYLAVLCHIGSFWIILDHIGSYWARLDHYGLYRSILDHIRPYWTILGYIRYIYSRIETYSAILGYTWSYCVILGYSGLHWTT